MAASLVFLTVVVVLTEGLSSSLEYVDMLDLTWVRWFCALLAAAMALFLLLAEVEGNFSGCVSAALCLLGCFVSDTRRDGTGAGAVVALVFEFEGAVVGGAFLAGCAVDVLASAVLAFVDPELLRLVGSCELDDSESELDELLSEPLELPLELPLDDDEPELESVLVDCKRYHSIIQKPI